MQRLQTRLDGLVLLAPKVHGVSDAEAERLLMQELATLEGSEIG